MEQGRRTLENIKEKFSIIDEYLDWVLMEHNTLGEDVIIAVNFKTEVYCFTEEDLEYTLNNRDEFTWYRMRKN